ncbi:transporter protein [Fusarium bulbicola]|nr:transporter protein [Fusarium bulbicola]
MASHTGSDNAISAAPLAATVDAKNHTSITSSPAAASLKNDAIATVASNRRWFSWHEPGTSPEERKLVFKLDWFMLSFACLMFFIKQLDQNNISNAYVSGMADELGFGPRNELSWMNTYFSVGTILGGLVSNLIITVVRPRIWLPSCLLTWSVFVLALFKCNHAYQFYVLRFFIGVFESAAWPGVMYCLGSWYRKSELARRSSLFVMSGVLGQMFSGYLQAALFTSMHGKGERSRQRIEEEGRKPVGKMDWSVIRRIFGSWQLYSFTAAYSFWTLTCGSYVMQYFGIYLKKTGLYSVPEINNIPTCIGAVNFVVMISTGYIADKLGGRALVCGVVGCWMILNYSILTAWDVPHKLRMAAFIMHGCYGCFTPLIAGWANEACGGDQQKRAFVLSFMVSVGSAVVIPFQQIQMVSGEAPEFSKTHGWGSALAWVVALTLWTGIGLPLVQRWRQKEVVVSDREDEVTEI